MYTNIYSNKKLSKKGSIWEIINNHGKIEIVKKDCFISKDKSYKKYLFVKDEEQEDDFFDEDKYEGFTEDTFCQNLNLNVDEIYHTSFRHLDLDILKKSWNEQVSALKISKIPTIYLCDLTLNTFADLLNLIKTKMKEDYDTIYLKSKNDTISIIIDMYENDDFEDIAFFVNEDYAEKLCSYVGEDNWDWDEGIYGTISQEKLDNYLRDCGGIDLTQTYLSSSKEKTEDEIKEMLLHCHKNLSEEEFNFLLLDALFSGDMFETTYYYLLPQLEGKDNDNYMYKLIGSKIFAFKIINEDNEFWYTKFDKFKKNNNIPQFNPTNFSNIYSNSIDELINIYNNNLDKFKINNI